MASTYKDSKGYPRFKNSGKPVHRAVAENKIGRKLRDHEVVHHKDGDKTNFTRGNLRVTSRSHHSKLHSKYKY
ncbi:MAG: HNH endonuclease [archaeon]